MQMTGVSTFGQTTGRSGSALGIESTPAVCVSVSACVLRVVRLCVFVCFRGREREKERKRERLGAEADAPRAHTQTHAHTGAGAEDRAFWVGALINPLPALGVAPEVRPSMLQSQDSLATIGIVTQGLQVCCST